MNQYLVSCKAYIPCAGEPIEHQSITKYILEYGEIEAIWKLLSSIENDIALGAICDNFIIIPIEK